jgi:hypothetical protein
MPASIGHNNPPFDFFALFDAVVTSSASAQQKLIQLVLARQAQKAGGSARPRRADILHQASCSEATFKRAYDLLKAGFTVTPHRGSTTEYAPRECVTVEQIEAAIAKMPHKTRGQGDTSLSQTRGHRERVSQNPGSPRPALGDTSFGKSDGQGDTGFKKETPPTPPKEKNNIYNNHPSIEAETGAGGGVGKGEIQGLNGATAHIVKTLGEWINPLMPDHRTAKGWLESSISMYGGAVVRDSFAELEAKVLHGDIVARPIPLLTKICQRRKNDGQKTRSGTQSSYSLSGNYTGKLL